MPNPIKYSTGSETLSLKKGNFFFGTGDVGKGPSDTTGYYNGVDVPKPGYVVYQYKSDAPGNLTYASFTADTAFINFTSELAGQTFTSTTQCFAYYAGQTDKICFNRDYEPIITDGLILNLDAGFDGSYPASGNTWGNLSITGNNGTLINNPNFYDNGGGGIVFDGTDDYINIPSTSGPSQQTIEIFFRANNISSKTLLVGNPVYRPRISLRNNVVTVYYGMETGTGDINFSFNSILASQYYQLVYTYSGGTNHKCYLNTVEGTRTFNGSALSGTPNFTSISLGVSAGSESYFNGQIFSFRLYNRVLSESEILQNYNAMKDRFAFIFTVDTTKAGTTSSTQFKLPLVSSGSINFVVEWGDGTTDTITTFNQAQTTHTYSSSGTYEIKIRGLLNGWQFNDGGDKLKMGVIKNWGCLDISVSAGFYGCSNMTCVANDAPVITTTSLANYFRTCSIFDGPIGNWDVSNVTSLFAMFYGSGSFKSPLNNWNVSKVQNFGALFVFTPYNSPLNNWNTSSATNMGEMFNVANSFNQDIGNWDVSKVTDMNYMFRGCPFNKDISNWDVSKVQNMTLMFSQSSFNQNIGSWNVSGVTNMSSMFLSSSVFNNGNSDSINNWNTSNVTNMSSMFQSSPFNQNIGNWNVSKVTNFLSMFRSTSTFNNGGSPSISGWTMSAATTFNNMFRGAASFNQPIGSWDTRNLTDIGLMFESANSFNQNIGTWDMSKVTSVGRSLRSQSFNNGGSSSINNWNLSGVTSLFGMFWDASQFNQPIKDWNITGVTTAGNFFTSGSQYSTANYDDILNTWSQKNVKSGVTINFASIKYSSAAAAGRATLVNTYGWTITDGGQL